LIDIPHCLSGQPFRLFFGFDSLYPSLGQQLSIRLLQVHGGQLLQGDVPYVRLDVIVNVAPIGLVSIYNDSRPILKKDLELSDIKEYICRKDIGFLVKDSQKIELLDNSSQKTIVILQENGRIDLRVSLPPKFKNILINDNPRITTFAGRNRSITIVVDEYISKPFSPKILVARVDALLRRSNKLDASDLVEAGNIVIDKTAHQVKVSGTPIELSFKEFELLLYFVENKGIALSREKILNNVWNYDYFGDARTIDTHVKKLRNKLGTSGDYIKTIWGMGYKFEI
jgi:hypothetical protein